MNNVFAKVKRLRNKPYFKLISDCAIFEPIDVDPASCVDYDPDHNLDEDDWFKVEGFSKRDYCINPLIGDFDSKDYDDLEKSRFQDIAFIFSVQGDDFYFQKITQSFYLSRKVIAFGEVAKVEENENRILVNEKPDAVYFKSSDTLVFRNLATISAIFKGIDTLFKEATDQEVENFLGESFIELEGGYDIEKVSKPNRKRIALAMDTLSNMSKDDRKDMLSYIKAYCKEKLDIDADNQNVKVSKDEELKLLLYGIEQRFYTTPFGKERKLANSVQSMD